MGEPPIFVVPPRPQGRERRPLLIPRKAVGAKYLPVPWRLSRAMQSFGWVPRMSQSRGRGQSRDAVRGSDTVPERLAQPIETRVDSGPMSTLAANFGRGNFEYPVCRRGMIDFRRSPVSKHPAVGFVPLGKGIVLLRPVYDRGFVAPVCQASHRATMGRGHHERPHGRFGKPGRSRPVRPVRVAHKSHAQISRRSLGL
jgi:hypothetical protein